MIKNFDTILEQIKSEKLKTIAVAMAEDVGTSVKDMEYIKMETSFVAGLTEEFGGSGDPSPFTALGTFEGIKASVKYRLGKDSLKGITVAVQGIGHVGLYLCEMLHEAGANLIVTDIYEEKLKEVSEKYGAKIVSDKEIYEVDAEVFAPCALGAIINDETIDKLKFKVIAGGANNQLLSYFCDSCLNTFQFICCINYFKIIFINSQIRHDRRNVFFLASQHCFCQPI